MQHNAGIEKCIRFHYLYVDRVTIVMINNKNTRRITFSIMLNPFSSKSLFNSFIERRSDIGKILWPVLIENDLMFFLYFLCYTYFYDLGEFITYTPRQV